MGAPNSSVGILVGAIIGTLAVLATIALTTFFCLLRRTDRMGKIKTFPSYSSRARDKTIQTYEFQNAPNATGSDRERERERERERDKERERRERERERERGGDPFAHLDDSNKPDKNDKNAGGTHGGKKDQPSGINRQNTPSKSPTQGLEGRLSDIFGSRKPGKSSGNGGGGYGGYDGYGRASDKKFTNSAKRAMYPGLSIASTQNRTMGDTTDYGDESEYGGGGQVGSEEGPVRAGSRMGSDPFTVGGRAEEGRGAQYDPNPWRDENRRDNVVDLSRSASPPNTHSNASNNPNPNARNYGYNNGLGPIPERSSSAYGNDAGSQISNTHSLHSNSQSVVSGTIPLLGKSGSGNGFGHHSSQSAGTPSAAGMGIGPLPITSRPSTATGATGYHLPTGLTKPVHQTQPLESINVGFSSGSNIGHRMDDINAPLQPPPTRRGGIEDDSLVDASITDDEEEAPRVRDDVLRLGDGARRDKHSEPSERCDRGVGTIAETKTIETTMTNQTNQTNRSRPSNHTHPSHGTNGTNQTDGSDFQPPWQKSMHPYATAQSPHLPTRELDNLDSMEGRLSPIKQNQYDQYGQPGSSGGLDLANLRISLSHPYSNPLVTATAVSAPSYPPPSSFNQPNNGGRARSDSRDRSENSFDEPRLHPYGQPYARSVDEDDAVSNSTHTHNLQHQPVPMGLGFEHPPFYDDPARNGSGSLSSQRGGSARLKRPPR